MKYLSILTMLCILTFSTISCSSDDGPEISIIAPVDGNAFKQNTSFDIVLSVLDDEGVDNLSIVNTKLGINQLETFEALTQSINYTLTVELGNADTDKYEFIIVATDADGNKDEEKLEIEVVE